MKRWIAHENPDTGWPTEAFLAVMADTQQDAKQIMEDAIRVRGSVGSPAERRRIWAIFIEAPRELPADDPRADLVTSPDKPVFVGFDKPLPGTTDADPTKDEVLRVLRRVRPPGVGGWRTVAELADMLERQESDMSRLLDELQKDGLVEAKDHSVALAMYRIAEHP